MEAYDQKNQEPIEVEDGWGLLGMCHRKFLRTCFSVSISKRFGLGFPSPLSITLCPLTHQGLAPSLVAGACLELFPW